LIPFGADFLDPLINIAEGFRGQGIAFFAPLLMDSDQPRLFENRNNTLRRKIGIHTNRHLLPQGIYYAGILKLAALAAREKVSGEHSKPRQEAAVHYTPVF
jgi:hypothetical protein